MPGSTGLGPPDFDRLGDPVRIHSTKFDGSQHYAYEGRLLDRTDELVRVYVPVGTWSVSHRGEGAMRAGMTQLFFFDRWYNVFHNHAAVGLRNMLTYANVGTPATLEGGVIRWVDLDIDVIQTDGSGIIVDDEDEFAEHRVRMAYPEDVVRRVLAARDELLAAARTGAFPFDRATHLP